MEAHWLGWGTGDRLQGHWGGRNNRRIPFLSGFSSSTVSAVMEHAAYRCRDGGSILEGLQGGRVSQ